MIVRERKNAFVMIEQDNHAHISGQIITNWNDPLFLEQELKESIEYAIFKHDYGWKSIDKQPFWNDQKQAPYSFIDFPTLPKLVFYKHGIDEVEKVDSYAGLLCSLHYTHFLLNDTSQEGQQFVQQEKNRQQRLIHSLPEFNKKELDMHFALLQLCDTLSLYICLNEPGVSKESEHLFFKNGIPTSSSLHLFKQNNINLYWKDKETIVMHEFPFNTPITLTLKQKVITKKSILDKGLIESYQETPIEQVDIRIVEGENRSMFKG